MSRIVGQGTEGSFVLQSQAAATNKGFGHVSKNWYDQTLSYEEGKEQIRRDKAVTEDLAVSWSKMQPRVSDKEEFVIEYEDGRQFKPTQHAMSQIGIKLGVGTWLLNNLREPVLNYKKTEKIYDRDEGDAETIVKIIANASRRLDQQKDFLFRTRQDGTLRAVLTDRYAIIDNEWFVDTLSEIIPGGRLSHWRGDGDTIFGNILIPDTIREESDSDYGGMLSIGNSEIGERRVSALPSVFRAICQNGCIWSQTFGKSLNKVHKGKIDLDSFKMLLKSELNEQIPLLPQGIDKLIGTRQMAWDGASIKPLFAQIAKDNRMTRKQTTSLLSAYSEEVVSPNSLFGVINSVTRAGQTFDNSEWVRFDQIGGELVNLDRSGWDRLCGRANHLSVKQVEESFLVE